MNPALPKKIGLYSAERKSGVKKWFFLFIAVVLAIFQITILDYFQIFNVKPDFFLIVVVMASLYFSFELRWAVFLSAFSGMLKDILGPNTFGINTLLFALWSVLIANLSKKISLDNNFISAAVIFVTVILNGAVIQLIFLFSGKFISWPVFLRIVLLESLYTALVLSIIFKKAYVQIK